MTNWHVQNLNAVSRVERKSTEVPSKVPQPQLEDGAISHPLRPTRLDKIKNLSDPVRTGSLDTDTDNVILSLLARTDHTSANSSTVIW